MSNEGGGKLCGFRQLGLGSSAGVEILNVRCGSTAWLTGGQNAVSRAP